MFSDKQKGAHVETQRGGTPGEGSPLTPSCAFTSTGGSARCGGRAGAPPLHPATFEKVDETFKRARSAQGVRA